MPDPTGPPSPATLAEGTRVLVRVPATSANLGPGFDCLGLALDLHDEVEAEVTAVGLGISVVGEGSGDLADDETHLVARALRAGLAAARVQAGGLVLQCRNAIPHGRGLGSSAAAVVAGLLAASGLAGAVDERHSLDERSLLDLATRLEGHPDNAAAALLGGATIAWCPPDGPRAVALDVHPDVRAVVCVPGHRLATSHARSVLPAEVAHADAAFTVGRAALLVHALSSRPELLLDATEDRLHQPQRAAVMPATARVVAGVRAAGHAAVVSGAGPSVLVLTTAMAASTALSAAVAVAGPDWSVRRLAVAAAARSHSGHPH